MADFEIQKPPAFSDKLRKFEVTDKAHADLFNAVVEVLINNDAFLKAVADDYNKKHKTDRDIHITSEERKTWNEKADTSIATNKAPGLLSAEDKTKLDGIAEGANKYTHPTTDGSKHVPATGTGSDEKLLMAGSTSGSFSWKHPSFTQATTRSNLESGEKLSVSLGKIMKWFADLKNGAFHTVANNLTTTVANHVLDARQGKALDDNKLDKTGNASNVTNTFTQATSRANITSGEKLSVSLGKIMKWFADLKTGAFYTAVNNLTTTAANYVLDARQGKVLNDNKLDKTGDASNVTNTFTQAASRANITSGEKQSVTFGKIMKFFADVISTNIAFMTVVNNGTTTTTNTLLDGRMGKTLLDKINTLSSKIGHQTKLNVSVGNGRIPFEWTIPSGYSYGFVVINSAATTSSIYVESSAVSGDGKISGVIRNGGSACNAHFDLYYFK